MGKRPTRRGGAASTIFYKLFVPGDMSGRIARFVRPHLAAQRAAEGKWRRVDYEDGSFAGYQPVEAPEKLPAKTTGAKAVIDELEAATITLDEMRMNAGEFGRSHTAGMPDWKRERRVERVQEKYDRIVAAEDAIERAIEKVRQWPYPQSRIGTDDKGNPIFGDRAVRCYPHAPEG